MGEVYLSQYMTYATYMYDNFDTHVFITKYTVHFN